MIVTTQLNAPVEPVSPQLVDENDRPVGVDDRVIDTVVVDVVGVNPVPTTVTETPLGPCVGVSVIVGTVTVSVPPAVSPELPLATTGLLVAVVDGTVNVQENAPLSVDVGRHGLGDGVTGVPSNVNTNPVSAKLKPLPVTVTVAPTSGPDGGVSVIDGVPAMVRANSPQGLVPGLSLTVGV